MRKKSLFEKLQQAEGLNLPDNRGKRHDLAVILAGVALALLSKWDGCLSSLHRHLVNHCEQMVTVLGIERKQAISWAQLPRVLEKVAVKVLNELLLAHCGLVLQEAEKQRFALAGKELKAAVALRRHVPRRWCVPLRTKVKAAPGRIIMTECVKAN